MLELIMKRQERKEDQTSILKGTLEALQTGCVIRQDTPRVVACAIERFIYFALWCNSLGLCWVGKDDLETWHAFKKENLHELQERLLRGVTTPERGTRLLGHPVPTTCRMFRDQQESIAQ